MILSKKLNTAEVKNQPNAIINELPVLLLLAYLFLVIFSSLLVGHRIKRKHLKRIRYVLRKCTN